MAAKVSDMMRLGSLVLAIGALVSLSVMAQELRRDVVRADLPGRVIFDRQCAPCHGTGPGDDGAAMQPGTAALARKYGGDLPAALELRSELALPVLRQFVRRGSGAMPMFRPSELTDADIAAIAEYLAATARLNFARGQ
jgi:mono/diheme cytochrome c family protein